MTASGSDPTEVPAQSARIDGTRAGDTSLSVKPPKPTWLLLTHWCVGLFLLTLATISFVGVVLFAMSLVIGTPLLPLAFRYGLLVQPLVWAIGAAASYRIHRSYSLTISLIITGIVVFFVLPFVFFIVVLVVFRG